MPSQSEEWRGLLEKAEHDWLAARIGLAHGAPLDTVCFHLHQTLEKLIKAALAHQGIHYPFTHDLEELLGLAVKVFPQLEEFQGQLADFTPYAVRMRYDSFLYPEVDEVSAAMELAAKLRDRIHRLLPRNQ